MAKAHITTPEGVKVDLEGSPAEISAVLKNLKVRSSQTSEGNARPARKVNNKTGRPQLVDLIESLIDAGFFKEPRDLASVKAALADMGYHYPVTTLSPTMLRKVRSRTLRRLKEKKRWFYVQ